MFAVSVHDCSEDLSMLLSNESQFLLVHKLGTTLPIYCKEIIAVLNFVRKLWAFENRSVRRLIAYSRLLNSVVLWRLFPSDNILL